MIRFLVFFLFRFCLFRLFFFLNRLCFRGLLLLLKLIFSLTRLVQHFLPLVRQFPDILRNIKTDFPFIVIADIDIQLQRQFFLFFLKLRDHTADKIFSRAAFNKFFAVLAQFTNQCAESAPTLIIFQRKFSTQGIHVFIRRTSVSRINLIQFPPALLTDSILFLFVVFKKLVLCEF